MDVTPLERLTPASVATQVMNGRDAIVPPQNLEAEAAAAEAAIAEVIAEEEPEEDAEAAADVESETAAVAEEEQAPE